MNQPGLSENIEYLNHRKLILVKLKQLEACELFIGHQDQDN